MNDLLLGLIGSLVGALIWVVKAMQTRSDKMIAQRDHEVAKMHERSDKLIAQRDLEVKRSLEALEASVDAFRRFEAHEHTVHQRLLDHMDTTAETQRQILVELRSMNERLPAPDDNSTRRGS